GNIVRDIAEANGFEINGGALFLAAYVINLLVTILTVVVMKALGRLRTVPDPDNLESWGAHGDSGVGSKGPDSDGRMPRQGSGSGTAVAVETEVRTATSPMTRQVWLTIGLIVVMVVGAVGFELPIGFLGLACGLVLAFTSLKTSEN